MVTKIENFVRALKDTTATIQTKLPLLTLFVHFMIVSIFYRNCDITDTNIHNKRIGFAVYYTLLCVMCVMWEYYCALDFYEKNYSFFTHKSRIMMGILSTIISLMILICSSYYFDMRGPFNCLFEYNNFMSGFLFCYGFLMVIGFSLFERFIWGVYKSVLPTHIDSEEENKNTEHIETQLENDYNNMNPASNFYALPTLYD